MYFPDSISKSHSDLQKKSVLYFLSGRQETEPRPREGPKVRQLAADKDKASFHFYTLPIQCCNEHISLLLSLWVKCSSLKFLNKIFNNSKMVHLQKLLFKIGTQC